MGRFVSFGTISELFGPFYLSLDHFRPFRPFQAVSDHLGPFGTVFGNVRPFRAILDQFRPTRAHLAYFGLRGHIGSFWST
jgi:hypothetical protein